MPPEAEAEFIDLATNAMLDPDVLMQALDDRFQPRPKSELPAIRRESEFATSEAVQRVVLGNPPLVVLTVRASGMIEVAEYGVRDELPGGYWLTPIDRGHRVPGLSDVLHPTQRSMMLVTLIGDVARRRSAKFQKCEHCGLRTAPEDWYGDGHCLSCLEGMGLIINR